MFVRMLNFVSGAAVPAILCGSLLAQCTGKLDQRFGDTGGILVSDLRISGTASLSSEQIHRIASTLLGHCFNEDNNELKERLRNEFQNRGYFQVEVQRLDVKVVDPLLTPKPVVLAFAANQGPRYKTGEITFVDNHAFTTAQLRDGFRLKRGDWFSREKIGAGLASLVKLYGASGHLDSWSVPDTEFGSENTNNLKVTINEGPQYRMGKLEVIAPKELAEKITAQWALSEGAVFDRTYPEKFLQDHRHLFPSGFQPDHIELSRDCRDLTANMRLPIDSMDPRSHTPFTDSGCAPPKYKLEEFYEHQRSPDS